MKTNDIKTLTSGQQIFMSRQSSRLAENEPVIFERVHFDLADWEREKAVPRLLVKFNGHSIVALATDLFLTFEEAQKRADKVAAKRSVPEDRSAHGIRVRELRELPEIKQSKISVDLPSIHSNKSTESVVVTATVTFEEAEAIAKLLNSLRQG